MYLVSDLSQKNCRVTGAESRADRLRRADILVLTPASLAAPMGHHLRARRSAPSTSSSSSPTAKVELEEVPEDIARRGCVNIVRWAAEKSFIKVSRADAL